MMPDVTYKKFDDCIENVKYTTKIQSKDYLSEGKFPIISQEDELISGYWNDENDVFHIARPLVIFGDHTRILKYVDFDFVLGADGVKILLPIKDLNAKFLLYYLKWCNVPSLGYSRHFKLLREIPIPIPSLDIQQSIVRELDAINAIIADKRQQLAELDTLAQAIFYNMFGDPITNEKGWEVKKLKDVVHKDCPISYGIVQPGDGEIDGVPVVRPVDLRGTICIERKGLKCTTSEISNSYKRTILNGDELLICVRGTTGVLGMVSHDLKGCNVTRGIVPLFFADDITNRWFIYSVLSTRELQTIIAENTYGATLKQINIKDLRELPIPLPPLPLQQAFAAKIEAIEQQKSAVRASLTEFESLLAQRLEHHFA